MNTELILILAGGGLLACWGLKRRFGARGDAAPADTDDGDALLVA